MKQVHEFFRFLCYFSHFFLLYSSSGCCVFITKIIFLPLSCFSFLFAPSRKKNYRLSAIYEQSCNKYIELSAFYVFESHREREKRTKLKCNMMHKMREVHINISNSFLHLLAFFIKEGGCLKISSSRELFSFILKIHIIIVSKRRLCLFYALFLQHCSIVQYRVVRKENSRNDKCKELILGIFLQ